MQIDPKQAALIQEYSEITGVPVEVVMFEALEEWLESAAPARLATLRKKIASA